MVVVDAIMMSKNEKWLDLEIDWHVMNSVISVFFFFATGVAKQ